MQFSGLEFNDDGDEFYEIDKSMGGGYSGGHMSGSQNYPYYGSRGNYRYYPDDGYMDTGRMDSGGGHMWGDHKYDSFRGKDTMTFSLNY